MRKWHLCGMNTPLARFAWMSLVFSVILCRKSTAQQLPIFTQYSENVGLVNPAAIHNDYTLKDYNINLGVTHRRQWNAIPNFPTTSIARASMLIETSGAVNLVTGLYILQDRVGPISTTGVYGRVGVVRTANYSNTSGFSGGLLLGGVQYKVGGTAEIATDPSDPKLVVAEEAQLYPDVGVGFSGFHQFDNGDNLSGGISAVQLFGLSTLSRDATGNFPVHRVPHYYGYLSYFKFIGEDSHFEVASWVKYVENVPVNADINFRYQFTNLMYFGLGGSTAGLGHFEFGVILGESLGWDSQQVKINYAYNPAFARFGVVFGNTHEMSISYGLSTY